MRENILIIGPMPEEANTGLAVALQCLTEGIKTREIHYSVANTARWGLPGQPGEKSLRRAVHSVMSSLEAAAKSLFYKNVYMTLSTSNGGFLRGALAIWVASVMRRRVTLHLHGGGFAAFYDAQGACFQAFVRQTMRRASRIVALGELLVDQFAMVPGYREKVVVIPNGFPANMEVPQVKVNKMVPGEPLRILYLSNLVPSKGILFLLEAVERLRAKGRVVKLDIAGSLKDVGAGEDSDFERFVADFYDAYERLGDTCTYHGTVFGEQKDTLFEKSDVFCLPTFYPWEGQPISIIEALAYGLPVIATPHKGIPEEVIDGQNGYLVEPRSADSIVTAIEHMLDDPENYADMSRTARKHFDENFTREVHQERLINCILGKE